MPDHAQTPASRRFLPTSSSSRSQQQHSSSRKATFSRTAQPASSSPFLRTPFTNPAGHLDDIETTFEKEEALSPISAVDQVKHVKASLKVTDCIEDEGDAEVANYKATKQYTPSMTIHPNQNDAIDMITDEARYDHKVIFSSPLPKRQKITHRADQRENVIEISSSSDASDVELRDLDVADTQDHHKPVGSEHEDERYDQVEDIDEGHAKRKRFRIRSQTGRGSKEDEARHHARSVFKGLSTSGTLWLETPLPATFSPSKRKGKYEYVYEGSADTVRNWILDVASNQSKATESSSQILGVTTSSTDTSGRFELVSDEDDRTWLLVHQEAQLGARHAPSHNHKQSVRSIAVKGAGTSWAIDMVDAISVQSPPGNHDKLHVAVFWESTAERGSNDHIA